MKNQSMGLMRANVVSAHLKGRHPDLGLSSFPVAGA
jgi:hypothetical protein